MSNSSQKQLLVWGYLREFFKSMSSELPPHDLITLFITWLSLMDHFDRQKCDSAIKFESHTCISKIVTMNRWSFACAVGSMRISKGDKQSWICKIDRKFTSVIVGIVDNATAECEGDIGDHSDEGNEGYGFGLNFFEKYYNEGQYDSDDDWPEERVREYFHYGQQFKTDHGFVMTITLDMTQQKGDHGILSYEFHMKPKDEIDEIRTDGEYTNVAWDDVDIDKEYRIAFSIKANAPNRKIEFLEEMPCMNMKTDLRL